MMRKLLVAALATVVAGFTASAPADAGGRGWHGKSYRGSGPQVRGYIARRGGYSPKVTAMAVTAAATCCATPRWKRTSRAQVRSTAAFSSIRAAPVRTTRTAVTRPT